MLKKPLALLAIAGMLASPLALAQTAPEPTNTNTTTTNTNVAAGGAAPGGLAGALGVTNTTLVIGAASIVVFGIGLAVADSSGSGGTTGTN